MENIRILPLNELMDQLAFHTNDYTKMLSENSRGESFESCQRKIAQLQAEIGVRRQTSVTGNLNNVAQNTNFL
jgi:hypothetical protein